MHGLHARAAGLLTAVHQRIRTLITMAGATVSDSVSRLRTENRDLRDHLEIAFANIND